MFRYAIVLLLISPYYYSLGFPTQPLLAVSLKTLSNHCENSFLSNQILEQISNCNITVSKTSEVGLHCMMFYDINSQLCLALKNSKIDLEEDYNKNFKTSTDVKSICNDVQSWEFGTLQEFPKYELITQKVVNSQFICLSICKEEDILSVEANFYCKYFKWGSHLLHNQKIASKQDVSKDMASKIEQPAINLVTNSTTVTTTNKAAENNLTKDIVLKDDNTGKAKQVVKANPIETKLALPQSDVTVESALISAPSANVSSDAAKDIVPVASQSEGSVISAVVKDKQQSVEEPPHKGEAKVKAAMNTKKDEEIKQTGLDAHVSNNEPIIESPKSRDLDDGQDDDIGNELDLEDDDTIGDQDNGIQDGDGQSLNDPKLEFDKIKTSNKKIESITSLNEDISQKEMFPNTVQDTFVEHDDSFFSLFISSILLVVLLYILYHNKNKLIKMLLGLIVEGRQAGRRRNSRGHAYRRLDTLEQAMNTNTAAPPSKIIY